MSLHYAKRGFATEEAMHYLGLKRRTFEAHILPLIKAKGVKVGTSTVYEKTDLDAAWEEFKTKPKGANQWQLQHNRESNLVLMGNSMLTATTLENAFARRRLKLMTKQKPTSR